MAETMNDEQCALEGCYTVDFLPITCNLCSKRFCTVHASTEKHQCNAVGLHSKIAPNPVANKRIPCSFPGCEAATLFFGDTSQPSNCPDCARVFCLSHRHATQHNCTQAKPSSSSGGSKSQALAQKAIENAKNSSSSSAKSKPRSQNPKMKAVELMKMRRKAEAANPRDNSADIPMDQRFFAMVSYESTEKTLWVQNNIVAGKALDLFASKLGVLSSPLTLRSIEGEPLQMHLPLSSQVESPANLVIERTVG